jgi:hypothetical protein
MAYSWAVLLGEKKEESESMLGADGTTQNRSFI